MIRRNFPPVARRSLTDAHILRRLGYTTVAERTVKISHMEEHAVGSGIWRRISDDEPQAVPRRTVETDAFRPVMSVLAYGYRLIS
jgi:hypothetical protein